LPFRGFVEALLPSAYPRRKSADTAASPSALALFIGLIPYFAPNPKRTAGIVWIRILRSSQTDQSSIYSRSKRTHSLKSLMELRPLICQRQVNPGFTLNLRR